MKTWFKGSWPALITPTTPTGDVNLDLLVELANHFLTKKVGGLYLCGSTGEGTLLSTEERMAVTETVLNELDKRIPVIVHVGSMSTRASVALAKHAAGEGADGVSSILPTVHGGIETTYRHFEAIASSVPDLPFFPYIFGGQVDAVTLMKELITRIPNIAGAKYTGPNMYEMGRIIELSPQKDNKGWAVFSGMDEQCIFGMMVDAPGNIGSTLNVMPGAYRQMRELYEQDELKEALELQKRVNRVTTLLIAKGFHGALREAIRLIGFDCGDPRLPHLALAKEDRQSLHRQLKQAGFADLAAL